MNSRNDSSRPLFMETTAIINHHFGTRTQRDFVIQASKGRRVTTCTFVLFEYKRVVQRACVEFHRLLTHTGSIIEALRAFGQSYSVSQLSIGYSLFPLIISSANNETPKVLKLLERFIDKRLSHLFHSNIDEITDATHCALAYQQPVRQGNTYAPGFLQVLK